MSSRERLVAGGLIVLALAVTWRWLSSADGPLPVESQPLPDAPAPGLPLEPGGAETPPDTVLEEGTSAEVQAAERALAAWAGFALTGDLGALHGAFVPGGPQHRQLTTEAESLWRFPPTEPVSLTLEAAEPRSGQAGPVVRAWVTYRSSSGLQPFCWDLHLREVDGELLLWTVVEVRQEGSQNPSPGVSGSASEPVSSNSCR